METQSHSKMPREFVARMAEFDAIIKSCLKLKAARTKSPGLANKQEVQDAMAELQEALVGYENRSN